MKILIADANHTDANRFYDVIRLASPAARCYVREPHVAERLPRNFQLDFVFIGTFGKLMTLEELIATIKQYSDKILIVHYSTSMTEMQRDGYKNPGCHATIERTPDIQAAVNDLKNVLNVAM